MIRTTSDYQEQLNKKEAELIIGLRSCFFFFYVRIIHYNLKIIIRYSRFSMSQFARSCRVG